MLKSFRTWFRFFALVAHLLWGVVLLLFAVGPDPDKRNEHDWRIILGWMQTLCRRLALRVHIEGTPVQGGALFVANHISWHDIAVLQSIVPTGFIAKSEIRGWFVIGWMAYRGNTLFIKRGKRDSFIDIMQGMQQRLGLGQSLLIFPEGTTSTGESVLPFKSRLYDPAIEQQVPVQAVALHYRSPSKTSAELAFINKVSFMRHLVRMLREPYIDVRVRFCEPIPTAGRERKELAEITEAQVTEAHRVHKMQLN
jgi:1-acyl-sn-glycerol-3-phosphate acyltransferase